MSVDASDYTVWRDNFGRILAIIFQILIGLLLPAIQTPREPLK